MFNWIQTSHRAASLQPAGVIYDRHTACKDLLDTTLDAIDQMENQILVGNP